MKEIQLTKDAVAIVDDEDYDSVNSTKWCLGGKYAIRRKGPRPGFIIYMHNEIMKVSKGIDHINQNTLDNRKENLRLATKAQNSMNRGRQSNNTTGFKGVCFCQGKYQAYIKFEGRKINLGVHVTPELAGMAYDEKAKELFGEFANLNFPKNASTFSSNL